MARKPKLSFPSKPVEVEPPDLAEPAPLAPRVNTHQAPWEPAEGAVRAEEGEYSAAKRTTVSESERQLAPLDVATLTQISDRLRAAFSQLVEQFPSRARSMGGMASWLGVSKSTAQRVYEGLDRKRSPIDALRRLPGPVALRAVVESSRQRLGETDAVLVSAAAIEQFEQLISSTSRSRQAFVDMLSMGIGDSSSAMPTKSERRALYAAAIKVCGESLNAKSAISIIDPIAKSSLLRESVVVSLLGARRRPFARPVVASLLAGWWSRENSAGSWSGDLQPSNTKESKSGLIAQIVDQFCTGAIRPVKIEGIDSRTALLIDFPDTPDRDNWLGPLDVSIRFEVKSTSNPLVEPRARICAAVRIAQPTQLLVHDVYVHHSIAARSVPTPGLFSFGALPGDLPGSGPGSDWFERLPDDTKIMVLGAGAVAASCDLVPRHTEIARYAIEAAKINPKDYVGYRCLVEFPVWMGEYRVCFPLVNPSA